ncbi:hypothetical protein K461DRAFT_283085 [Myriangium duriaei CBS 260.36]|uniref:Uncharacterized protein n=1 Tax=Myriangium duriaei CBS 260.36 TaxID=1168546 RepID=A0A9P4IT11_9PEZI|nr:hypothetical protein K461DRAFT_283085 [Myriangium duriaei CBS 260.36]
MNEAHVAALEQHQMMDALRQEGELNAIRSLTSQLPPWSHAQWQATSQPGPLFANRPKEEHPMNGMQIPMAIIESGQDRSGMLFYKSDTYGLNGRGVWPEDHPQDPRNRNKMRSGSRQTTTNAEPAPKVVDQPPQRPRHHKPVCKDTAKSAAEPAAETQPRYNLRRTTERAARESSRPPRLQPQIRIEAQAKVKAKARAEPKPRRQPARQSKAPAPSKVIKSTKKARTPKASTSTKAPTLRSTRSKTKA